MLFRVYLLFTLSTLGFTFVSIHKDDKDILRELPTLLAPISN